jgi:D-glycero-D-manno-heptose 1,7-bisphosphate phosphatase
VQLVILDRDGVINYDSKEHIRSPADWRPIEGSLAAIARLNQAGCQVVVATNQSGIARGLFTLEDMLHIHEKMNQALAQVGGQIDAVFFCPHGPEEGCECRKPRPGLLLDIAGRLGVNLLQVPVVGDALRDIQAAQAVGARPILVRTGKGREAERQGEGLEGVEVFDDLAAVSHRLLLQG